MFARRKFSQPAALQSPEAARRTGARAATDIEGTDMGRRTIAAAAAAGMVALAAPGAAQAEVPSVFGGKIACAVNAESGVRTCAGSTTTRVLSFDGQPLDLNVALPAVPANGKDGDFPLLVLLHGWGGGKSSMATLEGFAKRGYAVLSGSARGFTGSCGVQNRRDAECADPKWHVRLADTRYEVRDVQHLAGVLVDEGVVAPKRIGAAGGSYGGGQSMALAALKNRVMLPSGALAPWTSPKGVPMELAAAAPEIPWTDLAYSLMPNGRTLDYVADAPYGTRVGVQKLSFVAGLYGLGSASGYYAPPGTDEDADLTTWYAETAAGEPYDQNPLSVSIIEEFTSHHSSYYIDDSIEPAPLLIANGWTDDLFPADEALRFYNRTKTRYPQAKIGLTFLDYGHQRGQGKAKDTAINRARINRFLDHYLLRQGGVPDLGVQAITQTCAGDAGTLIEAPTWAKIARGEVRAVVKETASTVITNTGGDPRVGQAYDPISGGGACAGAAEGGPRDSSPPPGATDVPLPAATGEGYTLVGSPTVIADISSPVPTAQVAARLVDIAPDGKQILVARGLYRPDASGRQVFQLHANAWRFAPGHKAELQLLGHDAPYGRPSNVPFAVTVSNLELRLPVADAPGSNPAVTEPAAKVLPAGYAPARGITKVQRLR